MPTSIGGKVIKDVLVNRYSGMVVLNWICERAPIPGSNFVILRELNPGPLSVTPSGVLGAGYGPSPRPSPLTISGR